jgi:hypothetical protein
LEGVKWVISKKLFVEFGSRLTGSIAVSVIPSILQPSPEEPDSIRPKRLPIRGTAVVNLHPGRRQGDKPILLPPGDGFLELEIEPRASRMTNLE